MSQVKFEDKGKGAVPPGVYIGRVISVDEANYMCAVEGEFNTFCQSVMILNTGSGYSMPKVNDQIVYTKSPTGAWVMLGMVSFPTLPSGGGGVGGVGGVAAPASLRKVSPPSDFKMGFDGSSGGNSNDKKALSGNEFIRDIVGPGEDGGASNHRQPLKEGDHVLFDSPGGAHGITTTSGDVFFVFSDVNQMHFYKDNDLFKQCFKRGWQYWPGGVIKVGNYKAKDPSNAKQEDIDIDVYSTTLNDKKIRWRFQFGHNIEGGGGTEDIQRTDCYVGKPQGKQTQEKKIYTKQVKKTMAYKEEYKDIEEKKLASIDFLYTDQNKFKVELGKNDETKIKIDIDISTGATTVELVKGDLTIKATEGKISVQSGGETSIKSSGAMKIESSGTTEIKSSGDINLQASGSVNVS